MKEKNVIVTSHLPIDGIIELHRETRHYMPKGYEYIILFQKTLENVLTYDLSKIEMKVFIFILSQVGFSNVLIMPGLQELCAKRIQTHQPHVSKALKKLEELNVIVKENIPDTKSYRYRINYSLCAKSKGTDIKKNFINDSKQNPISPSTQTKLF